MTGTQPRDAAAFPWPVPLPRDAAAVEGPGFTLQARTAVTWNPQRVTATPVVAPAADSNPS